MIPEKGKKTSIDNRDRSEEYAEISQAIEYYLAYSDFPKTNLL